MEENKKFERSDKSILIAATLLLLISSALVLDDSWIYSYLSGDSGEKVRIGIVDMTKNDVRRRQDTQLTWSPLKSSTEVYQGDSIFTGSDSYATVLTDDGEEISIAPNSLVVINTNQDAINLSISFGSIKGKIEKGRKLLISSNNQITELTGNDAFIEVGAAAGKQLVVNVIEGEINITSNKGTKRFGKNEIAELNDKATKSKNLIVGLFPLANQKIQLDKTNTLSFRWNSGRPIRRPKITIGLDPKFKEVLHSGNLENNAKGFSYSNLPQDIVLYWKVNSDVINSDTLPFVIVGEQPPLPTFPKPGSHLFYDTTATQQKGLDVSLSWDKGSYADVFEVLLAQDIDFKKGVKKYKSFKTQLQTGILIPSEYYWKVRSADLPNQKWSATSYFNIGDQPMSDIGTPIMLTKKDTYILRTKKHNYTVRDLASTTSNKSQIVVDGTPEIRWAPIPEATGYILEIAKSPKFEAPIVQKSTTGTQFSWKSAQVGRYYWRVLADTPKYKTSKFSNPRFFKVEMEAPIALSKSSITEMVPDILLMNSPPPPFNLEWLPTVYTESYELQFSNNPKFQNAIRFYTKKSSRSVSVDTPGTYYWRVRSLNSRNEALSDFSNPYKIEFQRIYQNPEKLNNLMAIYPRTQDTIILVGQGENHLDFRWSNAYKNSFYRIEVSSESDFSNLLYSSLTPDNNFILRQNLPDGEIYWRVRAENKKFASPWSIPNRFYVTKEKLPFSFELSERIFTAKLQKREQEMILAEINRRKELKLRSPAAYSELRLDSPIAYNTFDSFTLTSKGKPKVIEKHMLTTFEKENLVSVPQLQWNKVENAERYVLEIARDRQFEKIIVKYPTTTTQYMWEDINPGKYYWRVQAFNEKYKRSDFSNIQELLVLVNSPQSGSRTVYTTPIEDIQTGFVEPNPFLLSWSPTPFAKGYEIEFSEYIDFRNSRSIKTPNTSHTFKVSKSGRYFWRVRSINDQGIAISKYSQTQNADILQTSRSPASVREVEGVYPLDNRTLVLVGEGLSKVFFHWIAPDMPNPKYQIEVSKTKDFSKVITRKLTQKRELALSSDLPDGPLYWRVGEYTSGKVKKWTKTYQFNLQKEKSSYIIKGEL